MAHDVGRDAHELQVVDLCQEFVPGTIFGMGFTTITAWAREFATGRPSLYGRIAWAEVYMISGKKTIIKEFERESIRDNW